jgi:PhzF family phenazine biosynthesis protein
MQTRRFIQCDVFTPVPTLGNALAVVVDGDELSEQVMQQFAAWTNLAETTFILPPLDAQADYRLKIYTPVRPPGCTVVVPRGSRTGCGRSAASG